MPSLPIKGPTALDGGELVVRDERDVLQLFPAEVRNSQSAPVRDALVAAIVAMQQEYQRRARRAAAQADVLRATSYHLAGLGRDREVPQQGDEDQEAYRARILGVPAMVTPDAILTAVNAILAPFTDKRAKYFESEVDCWFVHDGTASWDSFVFDGTSAASPRYLSRLYPGDAEENDGDAIEHRGVPGAAVFSDTIGRHFVLRVPDLDPAGVEGPFVFDSVDVDDGFFVEGGTGTWHAFVFVEQKLATELYQATVSTVTLLKGQGMRWTAFVDPLL